MAVQKNVANILVVDDDKLLADNLVEYLTQLGYQATAAYGGREGLTKLELGEFHLVITDLKMPEMDGLEVLEAIKAHNKKALVMVITGYSTIESAVEAMGKGAYDFIPKPFKLGELEVIVSRALERQNISKRLSVFRKLTLALIISIPFWLILGIILAFVWK